MGDIDLRRGGDLEPLNTEKASEKESAVELHVTKLSSGALVMGWCQVRVSAVMQAGG